MAMAASGVRAAAAEIAERATVAAMDNVGQLFAMLDEVRRVQAGTLGACGLGPAECEYRVLASGPHWCLRGYAPAQGWASVLIVASPIKRPYIWDVDEARSAIRYCLRRRLSVHLIEWKPATRGRGTAGLNEYADDAISECVARTRDRAGGQKPFLMGHSLGGTLAAIYAAVHPDSLQGVVLLGAPLCFERGRAGSGMPWCPSCPRHSPTQTSFQVRSCRR